MTYYQRVRRERIDRYVDLVLWSIACAVGFVGLAIMSLVVGVKLGIL
jgi:hypothetical protein